MPERLARTDPNTAVKEMTGSGPFRFIASEYNSGSTVVYEKFDRYVPRAEPADTLSGGKIAHFKRVEWVVIPDNATAAAALGNGEADWWERPMVDLVPTLKAKAVGMRKLSSPEVVTGALNTLKGRARIKRTMWSRRAQEYEAKIDSGDLVSIAEVVRDLHRAGGQPEQSYSERQLYEKALARMAREVAAVEKTDEPTAVKRVEGMLTKKAA